MLETSLFSFPYNFFPTLLLTRVITCITFVLSTPIAFISDQSEILSNGKKFQNLNISISILRDSPFQPITRRQNFRQIQIKTNCRRHFKVHLT